MNFIKVTSLYDNESIIINTHKIITVSKKNNCTDIYFKDGGTYNHLRVKESVDEIFNLINAPIV